jgi:hypothetical protein
LTLLEWNNHLTDLLSELTDEKIARMNEVNKLEAQIDNLTEQLGMTTALQRLTKVPTVEEFEERRSCASVLEKERVRNSLELVKNAAAPIWHDGRTPDRLCNELIGNDSA